MVCFVDYFGMLELTDLGLFWDVWLVFVLVDFVCLDSFGCVGLFDLVSCVVCVVYFWLLVFCLFVGCLFDCVFLMFWFGV